jgi:dihydrofolate reductase
MSTFKGIVAMSQNRAIGKGNELLWNFKDDLKHFKEKTWNGQVVLGRKTWEGMPSKWLRNRSLWIVTRENKYGWLQASTQNKYSPSTLNIVTDISHLPENNYWIAGGAEIYSLFLDKITEFYVTFIKEEYPEADKFMPEFEHLFSQKETLQSFEKYDIVKYIK